MTLARRWLASASIAACVLFTGCAGGSHETKPAPSATVESVSIGGAMQTAVKLTAQAARRLDVQTVAVSQAPDGRVTARQRSSGRSANRQGPRAIGPIAPGTVRH